ncbi:glutaredoxin family protein [Congregibacter variabilis]|uniref:Glutaredoxin family protein n=1 Tax=Congregibacter variabilis TaxID=3081200 RepID=A0ABZ0I5B7_9GAMM|nr:glutaredoxin family protein [Congregibacter sp. IMCC43200]
MLDSWPQKGRMMNEVPLILYSTDGCHLCDEAQALLLEEQKCRKDLRWQVVDIANDDALFDRYGWLIPVLHNTGTPSGAGAAQELRWPFNAQTLRDFLASQSSF